MPFAGYKDFSDCEKKNKDKSDPSAYCGSIMRKVERGEDYQELVKFFNGKEISDIDRGNVEYNIKIGDTKVVVLKFGGKIVMAVNKRLPLSKATYNLNGKNLPDAIRRFAKDANAKAKRGFVSDFLRR